PEPGQEGGADAINGTRALRRIPLVDPGDANHNNIYVMGDFNCDTMDADDESQTACRAAFTPFTNGPMDDPVGLEYSLDIDVGAYSSLKRVESATADNYFSCAYDKILSPQLADANGGTVINLVRGQPNGYPGIADWA